MARLIHPEQGCLHLDATHTTGPARGPGTLPYFFILQTYPMDKR
jgi:hypothetical protein